MWQISVKVSTKATSCVEYEGNMSTNEKVITEKQNLLLKNIVEYQGHPKVKVSMLDLSNNVCEYEVIGWLMKKLLEENETSMQIVNDMGRPPTQPDGFTNL